MINVAAYVRYFSDNQRDTSVDTQVLAIKKYAEENNLNIVKIYIDRSKFVTKDNRASFNEMICDSKNRVFEQVIVHTISRFARNRFNLAHNRHLLRINGVGLRSVLENLDGSPESIIIDTVLEGMVDYYSRLNLAGLNSWDGSNCPFCQSKEAGGETL